MTFSKKYKHIGYSYAGVPKGWVDITERALIRIEKVMWPQWWLPFFIKRWIHYLATGNSVVRIKYRWAYNLRTKLTHGQIVQDVKDKYASLRIYCCGGEEMHNIIAGAEKECVATCEECGSKDDVHMFDTGWVYNICRECRFKIVKDLNISQLERAFVMVN
jgi:hypothetical protein